MRLSLPEVLLTPNEEHFERAMKRRSQKDRRLPVDRVQSDSLGKTSISGSSFLMVAATPFSSTAMTLFPMQLADDEYSPICRLSSNLDYHWLTSNVVRRQGRRSENIIRLSRFGSIQTSRHRIPRHIAKSQPSRFGRLRKTAGSIGPGLLAARPTCLVAIGTTGWKRNH